MLGSTLSPRFASSPSEGNPSEGSEGCQSCRRSFVRSGAKDLSRHCHSCGLFRKSVDGFVKSYPATNEGAIRWMDNFARLRDLAEDIEVGGVKVRRKPAVSLGDHYSAASIASTTYFAYFPNREYVEELVKVKRILPPAD